MTGPGIGYGDDLRPRIRHQRFRHRIPRREGRADHGAVDERDEEDLRVEHGADGVDEDLPAGAPVDLAGEDLQVVAQRARLVDLAALVARDASCWVGKWLAGGAWM